MGAHLENLLRRAFELEGPGGIASVDHSVGFIVVQGNRLKRKRLLVLEQRLPRDYLHSVLDRGEHPQVQEVELDETHVLDIDFVEGDDVDALRAPLERRDALDRQAGHDDPARMRPNVTGKTGDLRAALKEHLESVDREIQSAQLWQLIQQPLDAACVREAR